jgi:hypothetical protein
MAPIRCTLIISFHEGWSAGADLETDFFTAGFFTGADFLAGAAFLVALDLVTRDDLERDGDFFPTAAASGAGEARGDGRGDDIA